MRLVEFAVQGFRSLEDVGPIRLGNLAVLVGPNDSGKTACLTALSWLLTGAPLVDEDRTLADPTAEASDAGEETVIVTCVEASFEATEYEQQRFEFPSQVRLRRYAPVGETPRYEILQQVCSDVDLRDLESMSRDALRDEAGRRHLDVVGNKNAKITYLKPLAELRDSLDTVQEWTPASRVLIGRLPKLLTFSSTAQPNPEIQMRSALKAAYDRILTTSKVKGSLEKIEQTVSRELRGEAEELCAHIQTHCPELERVVAEPNVSFSSGFTGVSLRTSRANDEEIDLRRSGAGKQQRVTLAIWEWSSKLAEHADEEAAEIIIAYDEPDTHLDYERQRGFLDLMHKQSAMNGIQVVLATHSLNLLDRVDMTSIISLRSTDANRTSIDAVIDDSHEGLNMFASDLTQSLGLRNSVLLNEKCFLVVEGETERICFPILFRLYHGLPLQSVGIALMACGGNEGALKVARFLIDHGRAVFFLLDSDSATHPSTRKLFSPDKLTAHGIPSENRLYVGDPNELEELFSDEVWTEIANERWPRTDERLWEVSDIAAMRSEGKFSATAERTFRESSLLGPSGKPEMLSTLVGSLKRKEDVPEQLAERFDQVLAGAG